VRDERSGSDGPGRPRVPGTTSGRLLKRIPLLDPGHPIPGGVRLERVSNVCQGGTFDQGVNERNIRSERLFSSALDTWLSGGRQGPNEASTNRPDVLRGVAEILLTMLAQKR
jgi:hypothetical protein